MFYDCNYYDHKLLFSLGRKLRSQFTILAKASISCERSFVVLATVITIVNYDRKTFILQATELKDAQGPMP
jgi:hypothetical protein